MHEPLRGKKKILQKGVDIHEEPNSPCLYFSNYEHFTYEDVESAVMFYKKYESYMDKFCDDFQEEFLKFDNSFSGDVNNINEIIIDFNKWLFDYCFMDVI